MDEEAFNEMALHQAAKDGNHGLMRELLGTGTYPDAADIDHGWTPLMFAAKRGHAACVRLLIQYGAYRCTGVSDYNEPQSILSLAAGTGSEACVRLLLEAGAEVEGALPMAVMNGHIQCAKILLKAGVRPHEFKDIKKFVGSNREMRKVVFAAGADKYYKQRTQGVRSLKETCRTAVRRQLLNVGEPVNLFHKVPLLGLPSLIEDYLLYNVSLD